MGRPATGETPQRSVRVPDPIWEAAAANAKAENRTVSDVIVDALRRYNAAASRRAKQQPPTDH